LRIAGFHQGQVWPAILLTLAGWLLLAGTPPGCARPPRCSAPGPGSIGASPGLLFGAISAGFTR